MIWSAESPKRSKASRRRGESLICPQLFLSQPTSETPGSNSGCSPADCPDSPATFVSAKMGLSPSRLPTTLPEPLDPAAHGQRARTRSHRALAGDECSPPFGRGAGGEGLRARSDLVDRQRQSPGGHAVDRLAARASPGRPRRASGLRRLAVGGSARTPGHGRHRPACGRRRGQSPARRRIAPP